VSEGAADLLVPAARKAIRLVVMEVDDASSCRDAAVGSRGFILVPDGRRAVAVEDAPERDIGDDEFRRP